jgi:hypothetical protein
MVTVGIGPKRLSRLCQLFGVDRLSKSMHRPLSDARIKTHQKAGTGADRPDRPPNSPSLQGISVKEPLRSALQAVLDGTFALAAIGQVERLRKAGSACRTCNVTYKSCYEKTLMPNQLLKCNATA